MKKWYKSKTIIINIISLLIMVVGTIAGWPELREYGPTLLMIMNVLNLSLRALTYEGLH
jgi:hypothetical protein